MPAIRCRNRFERELGIIVRDFVVFTSSECKSAASEDGKTSGQERFIVGSFEANIPSPWLVSVWAVTLAVQEGTAGGHLVGRSRWWR